MGVVDDLIRAREAYDRRDWLAAYGGLSDAAAGRAHADDFVRLATAAYLVGRRNDCVQALQRAYQLQRRRRRRPGRRAQRVLAGLGAAHQRRGGGRRRLGRLGRNGCSPRSTATWSSAGTCSST